VKQQTLNFDPETGITAPLRSKEDAHDYRYFPEPDLPPVVITPDFLQHIKSELALLPWTLREHFITAFSLPEYDANLLTEEKERALFFMEMAKHDINYKSGANLIINKILPWCNEQKLEIGQFPVSFKQLSAFIQLIDGGKVSNSNAYQRIFPQLIEQPERSPLEIAKELNLIQTSDEDFLEKIVDEVLAKNPDKVSAYQKGKKGLLGFFVGEVMRQSKGKAEPKTTNALLIKKLEN